jgi:hypothetical protein
VCVSLSHFTEIDQFFVYDLPTFCLASHKS